MRRGILRFNRNLMAGGLTRRSRRVVFPNACEWSAGGIADVRRAARTEHRARRNSLTILRHHTAPQLAAVAKTREKRLFVRSQPLRVAAERVVSLRIRAFRAPLAAPENEINFRRAVCHSDAPRASAVMKIARRNRLQGSGRIQHRDQAVTIRSAYRRLNGSLVL